MIKIQGWYGRFGNNFFQLLNVLHIAFFYNYSIDIISHKFFEKNLINRTIENDNNVLLTDNDKNFFSKPQFIPSEIYNLNCEKVINTLRDAFIIKDVTSLGENDLVIHIRSGDIFLNKYPHTGYIVPPLSYYVDIIEKNSFNKIIIVAEDNSNPTIGKLLELYPNIIFKQQNLVEDMKLILGAKNLVESFGTFTQALILLSYNIKNIYRPSYQLKCYSHHHKSSESINIHITELKNYRSKLLPWNNTPEQREFLLNYKL
jgi:hypothetical protein